MTEETAEVATPPKKPASRTASSTPKAKTATTRTSTKTARPASRNGTTTARRTRAVESQPEVEAAVVEEPEEAYYYDDEAERDEEERYQAAAPRSYAPPGPAYPGLDRDRASAWRIFGVLGALVAVLLVASLVFLAVKVSSQDAANARRNTVLADAEKYGVYLSSYNYKNLTGSGADWTLVMNNATATFKHDFSQTSGSLGQLLTQYNATATGKVVAAGIASLTSSRAVVLMFIDQTVTNKANKSTPVAQPLRVELTLLHQGGRWLINTLELPS
jgi:Mce-associated membrane protein